MITKITLKNWQRHKSLELELGSVTTIIGPTNAGKSAILRALAWLAVGNVPGFVPKAKKMVRHGAKRTTVTLEFGKSKISRSKGDKNFYHVNGTRLTAFGQKVPDEVSKLLNVNELNFQKQVGMPFWFSESPGQLSKQMNEIVDLSVIDETLKNLGKMISKSKSKHEVVSEELKTTREKRDELKLVTEANEFLVWLEQAEKKAKTHRIRAQRLRDYLATGANARKALVMQKTLLVQAKGVLAHGIAWSGQRQKNYELGNLINEGEIWNRHSKLPNMEPETLELEQLDGNLAITQQESQNLWGLVDKGQHETLKLKAAQEKIWELQRKLSKFKECPLCERPL